MKGWVVSGKGEGRFYLSKKKYAEQFSENLGFLPYPGTLDVKLDGTQIRKEPDILIKGFRENGEIRGDVLCFKSKLIYRGKETPCYTIIPILTSHKNVIEVIHKENLREKLKIEDGDEVEIEIN